MLYISSTQTNITVADQNFANVKHVVKHTIGYNSYGNVKGWIRPKYSSKPTPPTPSKKMKIYKVDDMKKVNDIWQMKCNALAPTGFTWNDNGIDEVDANGNKTKDQVFQKGSYFIFKTGNIHALTNAQKGAGGYYWLESKMNNSGNVWLSTKSLNALLYQ